MFRRRARRSTPPAPDLDVAELAGPYLEAGDPTGWFDALYRRADRQVEAVPWAALAPHPYLTDWLAAPLEDPGGNRAAVVGCGLGDDAVELANRGYEVTAFDVSETAITWARERFARVPIDWRTVDVLAVPEEFVGAFDLVVEIRTVQSLPGVVRDAAMQAVGSLVAPGGVAVVVTLLATDADRTQAWEGPPWAQAPSELAAYGAAGLERVALEHPDPDGSGVLEVRLTLKRPSQPDGPALPVFPG